MKPQPLSGAVEKLRDDLKKLDPDITEARTELRRVLGDELLGVEGAAKKKKGVRKRLDDLVEKRSDIELQIAEIEDRIELLAERDRQKELDEKRVQAIRAGETLLEHIRREADAFDQLSGAQQSRHAAVRPFYAAVHDVLGKAPKALYDDSLEVPRQRPSILSWRDSQVNRVQSLLRELRNVSTSLDEVRND